MVQYTFQCLLALAFKAFSESLYPAITTFNFVCSPPSFSLVVMSQPLRGFDGIAILLNWQLSLNGWHTTNGAKVTAFSIIKHLSMMKFKAMIECWNSKTTAITYSIGNVGHKPQMVSIRGSHGLKTLHLMQRSETNTKEKSDSSYGFKRCFTSCRLKTARFDNFPSFLFISQKKASASMSLGSTFKSCSYVRRAFIKSPL